MTDTVRVAVGEDDVLLRNGVVRVLTDAGFEVVAEAGDARELLAKTLAYEPDVAVVDIGLPPGHGDDGLRVAVELRHRLPMMGVVVLTQHDAPEYALELIGERFDRVGYLLKERVGDVHDFCSDVLRVAHGGSALDPSVVARMMQPRKVPEQLALLTDRERDVLAAMAQGQSNAGIARSLLISVAAVEKHVTSIFRKLGIAVDGTGHRRVQAVLRYFATQRE
ncbi:response regulator transcription factor [Curtobacterium sp. ISL-83]|uniref:response regulator transcription factor n=1 Tax=Curtobacterium sp. ISL-83 TaxID=2819145 RepID=UPI001BE77233|nr:response regulator transcription factor [Curtobacterium sp. ISL-83]MBT2502840.1 response regulator transcription factor [Curtobacterium sp. ISL-83]